MHTTRVRDIIIPLENYPHFTEETTLREAMDVMENVQIVRQHRNSLPRVALVFASDRRTLVGLLRRRDILRGLLPDFLKTGGVDYERKLFEVETDPNLAEVSTGRLVAVMREVAGRQVSEVMVPIVGAIDYDDSILKAIHLMVGEDTSLIPVSREGLVVGVVRSVDVMQVVFAALR